MSRSSIVVTVELPETVMERLRVRFDVRRASARQVDEEFLRCCDGAVAIATAPVDRFDAAAIAALPASVRALVSYSVGLDHIDLAAARARGLIVTNTPDVLTDATADLAILLILSTARGASRAERSLRAGQWKGWRPSNVFGVDLRGKTLGIIGYGRIGQATAHRASAFGMRTIFYDRRGAGRKDPIAEPVADLGAFYSLCDIVSLHAPSTTETRGMIDRGAIAQMKSGVILVNTARGDLVVDDDVIEAARTGRISALGFDVFRGEPNFDPRYLDLPNATLLPHIGSSTLETRAAMGAKVVDNLVAVDEGRDPPDRVF